MRDEQPLSRRSSTIALIFFTLSLGATVQAQTTYHVSPSGDDRNDGKTPAAAWRSVARVKAQVFVSGDQILFERRGEWRECLTLSSSGTAARPIVFGTYGSGPKPKFWGSDVLDPGKFQPEKGGIFKIAVAKTVYAVLIDHQFLRSVSLMFKNGDATANLDHVRSHPGSWSYRE